MTRPAGASLALWLVAAVAGASADDVRPDRLASGARPRVLLTAERLAELRALRETSHREVFAVARAETDVYLTLPLPADRSRAVNAYRAHGKMLPALALMHRLTDDPAYLEAARRWLRRLAGFGPGHAHPDINAFSIFARGQWLAVDPGYSRVKDTRDHSTVIVNGRGQAGEGGAWLDYWAFQQRQPPPAILRAESTRDDDTVLGDAAGIYVDEARVRHFRRQILFLKPDVFVVADDLAAHGASRFEWLLHAPEGSLTLADGGGFEIARPGVRLRGLAGPADPLLVPETQRGPREAR